MRYIYGDGSGESGLAIVGAAPGLLEVDHDKPFAGRALEVLEDIVYYLGWRLPQVYATNAVKVMPPMGHALTAIELISWQETLATELIYYEPEVILCLGKTPAVVMGYSPDATLAQMRKASKEEASLVKVTYSIEDIIKKPALWKNVQKDLDNVQESMLFLKT